MPPLRRVVHAQQPVGGNRLGLALQLERLDRLDLDRLAYERERRLPDQHLARLRRLLQPSGDVDRIAGREPLLRSRHHLARHDADPPLQPELGQRVPHLDRRPHGAQRVVLVHTGTPNTAITASPMNFSTLPPWRSTIAFIRSK